MPAPVWGEDLNWDDPDYTTICQDYGVPELVEELFGFFNFIKQLRTKFSLPDQDLEDYYIPEDVPDDVPARWEFSPAGLARMRHLRPAMASDDAFYFICGVQNEAAELHLVDKILCQVPVPSSGMTPASVEAQIQHLSQALHSPQRMHRLEEELTPEDEYDDDHYDLWEDDEEFISCRKRIRERSARAREVHTAEIRANIQLQLWRNLAYAQQAQLKALEGGHAGPLSSDGAGAKRPQEEDDHTIGKTARARPVQVRRMNDVISIHDSSEP